VDEDGEPVHETDGEDRGDAVAAPDLVREYRTDVGC